MIENYSNLSWALDLNPNLKRMFIEEHGSNTDYLSDLDSLIVDLISFECNNIQEEIKDVSDLNKLSSIISELEIARLVGNNGNNITLLPDDYFQGRSPDILCENEMINSYIEVERFNETPYISDKIVDYLRSLLSDYPYRIDVGLKNELSIPKANREERIKQNILVDSCIEKFDSAFKNGVFYEFPFEIDTNHMIFKIYETDYGDGYPGIIDSKCIKIPTNDLCDYVKDRLIRKAKKRDDFESHHRTYPYILAFDCKQPFMDDDDIDNLLYGIDHSIPIIPLESSPAEKGKQIIWRDSEWKKIVDEKEQSESWTEIDNAKENGWNAFLLEKKIIPNDYTYRSEEGLFVSDPLMKNVSAVLFKDMFGNVSFFPNPFCFNEINHPNLQEIIGLNSTTSTTCPPPS